MTTPKLKVVAVTLDVDGLRFCETQSTLAAEEKRSKWYNKILSRDKSCESPALFNDIFAHMQQEDTDIFIVSTQDEDTRNTYLHSDFLPNQLRELGYVNYQRHVLKNVGQLSQDDSDNNGSALRISIFVKESAYSMWMSSKVELDNKFPSYKNLVLKGKYHGGAIACHLKHINFGHIVIIAANLPNADNITSLSAQEYSTYREYTNTIVQQGLIDIARAFWTNPALPIDHIFLLGDFASDLELPKSGTINPSDILKYDFLTSLTKNIQVLSGMKEGVNDAGPTFYPTYRLHKHRDCDGKTIQCYETKGVKRYGYPDRIFYRDLNSGNTSCKSYDRINNGAMLDSQHAGVIGTFTISF